MEIVVVDRYHLPVAYADVRVLLTHYAGGLGGRTDAMFWSEIPNLSTDVGGSVTFELAPNTRALAEVTRPGYATSTVYPIFAGYRYECVLLIGGHALFRCVNQDGDPVTDAEVRLYWWSDPDGATQETLGSEPRLCSSDAQGIVSFQYVPRGQLEAIAASPTAGVAHAAMQFFGWIGREPFLSMYEVPLVFEAPLISRVKVLDPNGDPVQGLVARLDSGLHEFVYPTPQVIGEFIEVGPIHRELAQDLTLYAPGFQSAVVRIEPDGPEKVVILQWQILADWRFEWPQTSRSDELLTVLPQNMWDEPQVIGGPQMGACVFDAIPGNGPKAVLMRDWVVDSFLCASGGELAQIPAASLEVHYSVGDTRPVSAYVRVRLRTPAPGVGPVIPGMGLSCLPTDPSGVLRLDGLIPGTYELEPHFHFAVHEESLSEVQIAPGEVVVLDVRVSRGQVLRGTVMDAETDKSVDHGYVSYRSDNLREHFPICPVDSIGRFLITGLKEGATYTFSYSSAPWPGWPAYRPSPGVNVHRGSVQVEIAGEETVVIYAR